MEILAAAERIIDKHLHVQILLCKELPGSITHEDLEKFSQRGNLVMTENGCGPVMWDASMDISDTQTQREILQILDVSTTKKVNDLLRKSREMEFLHRRNFYKTFKQFANTPVESFLLYGELQKQLPDIIHYWIRMRILASLLEETLDAQRAD